MPGVLHRRWCCRYSTLRVVPSPVCFLFGSAFSWLDLLLLQLPLFALHAFSTLLVGCPASLPSGEAAASWPLMPPSEMAAYLLQSMAPSEMAAHLLYLMAPSEMPGGSLGQSWLWRCSSELLAVVELALLGPDALLIVAIGGARLWLCLGVPRLRQYLLSAEPVAVTPVLGCRLPRAALT